MASISPEVIIACLSFLLSFLAILFTSIAIYQDDTLWKCINILTSGFHSAIHRQPKKRHVAINNTGRPDAAVTNRPVPWEDIFTVPESTDTAANAVLKEGTCIKCKVYTAKRNCKYSACGWCCRGNPASVCRAHGMGYSAACNELNEALHYGYLEVDISYSNLKMCPPQLCSLQTHVVSLNLSNNRLSHLPEGIGQLTGLKELFLQYNDLIYLPDSICHMTNLLELDVKSNSLSSLPPLIGRLHNLHTLCLMNNSLTSLPSSIGLLHRLEELSLHSNNLNCLPIELCQLQSLKLLYCGENKLSSLPRDIGHLTLLEELDLSHNQLVSLPPSLCNCVSLVRLWLTGNRLEVLPVMIRQLCHLKELHLRRNSLRYFPPSITGLPLTTFSAQFNPILKEHQTTPLNHTPKHSFPPLLELSARTVSSQEVPYSKGDIPLSLEVMLSRGTPCSGCGQTVFMYYSRTIVFQIVGVYYRLPLCHTHCAPHSKCTH